LVKQATAQKDSRSHPVGPTLYASLQGYDGIRSIVFVRQGLPQAELKEQVFGRFSRFGPEYF